MKKIVCALLLLLIFVISGCAENPQPKKVDANGAPKLSLNVCSSMSEAVTKLLVEEYARKSGVEVKVKYLPAGSFAEKIDFLRADKFDCWLGGTAEEYYLADQQSMLAPYKPQEFYKMPAELRSRQGQWTSLYLEYIAFVSNTEKLEKKKLYAPDTWEELLLPEFKDEITMPNFVNGGASYGMITSIWQLRGKEAALEYAGKLNGQNIVYTDNIAEAVDKVHKGEKMVAVVPLRTAILQELKHKHLFATVVKDANRNLLNCVAVMNDAENLNEARGFIDYLISDESEALLRSKGYQYIWHAKNYPYNDGRKELIGNVNVPMDDLSWTAFEKNEIISQWLKANLNHSENTNNNEENTEPVKMEERT